MPRGRPRTGEDSGDGPGTCKTDAHLLQASGLTFSPGDKFLYVTGTGDSEQIEVYSHNKKTGALTDVQCISQAPAPSGCSTGRVVGDTQDIVLSPNGLHAYAGQYSIGLSVFNRNPTTGKLTQKSGTAGCITNNALHVSGRVGHLRIAFKLSVPDLVTLTFRQGSHRLPGRLVESGKAGVNKFGFAGKVGGHVLGRGTYQVTATPVGGKPKKAKFTVRP
jgi:hypothetical protein